MVGPAFARLQPKPEDIMSILPLFPWALDQAFVRTHRTRRKKFPTLHAQCHTQELSREAAVVTVLYTTPFLSSDVFLPKSPQTARSQR